MDKKRYLLVENNFSKDKKDKSYLLEFDGGKNYLEKCKKDKNLPVYLVGKIQEGDRPNRNGRIYPFEILKKECDRYLNEQVKNKQAYGECFTSSDFEVLTENGWKQFSELSINEKVLTSNIENLNGEYNKIQNIVELDYNDKVYNFNSRNLKTEVTSNHRFLIKDRNNKYSIATSFEIYNNRTKFSHSQIVKNIVWKGINENSFVIKGVDTINKKYKLENGNEIYSMDLFLDTKLFFFFLGFYLAEGGVHDTNHIILSQNKGEKFDKIISVINKLGFNYTLTDNNKNTNVIISIIDPRLHTFLKQFGGMYDKKIVSKIKEYSSEYLLELINGFALGDGRVHYKDGKRTENNRNIFTVSYQLILDLQECWLKAGGTGNITTNISKEDYMYAGHLIKAENKKPLYILNLSKVKGIHLDKRFLKIEEKEFNGKVFCLTIENNHNFYVKQNGKVFLTMNCDHPLESAVPELKNASHVIQDIWYKGKEVWAKIKLLNAYAEGNDPALKARSIVLNEQVLGISSRALGSVHEDYDGHDIIEDDLEIICWDLVSQPSTFNANLSLKEATIKNKTKMLTESQIFGKNGYNRKSLINKLNENLTFEEKAYLNILGVEKFLRIKKHS